MNQIDMDARKKQAEGCGCNGCKTELDYINMIEVLRDRVADRERFIATLEGAILKENRVVLELRAENERLRAALAQIADRENWMISQPDEYGGTNYEWIGDSGEAFDLAAAALAALAAVGV